VFNLLALVPWYYRIAAVAALALSLFGYGYLKGVQHHEAATADADRRALEAGNVQVTRYIDRVRTIDRNVPLAAAAIERMCDNRKLPGAGRTDAAAGADAGIRSDTVAADIGACARNSARLAALQAALRPQVAR
jgi:hypothetical protein